MLETLELLRTERAGRLFFAAYAQSALGTGAAYVALVVLAYQRGHSVWAIALVLMADFIPAMICGPVFGAVADRWSRRWCLVVSDLVRAAAFVGIAMVGGIEATIALALLAGAGAGLFTPAALAALPSVVHESRRPAATSLYGALSDFGRTAGPAIAALGLAFGGAEPVVLLNGATFLLSALVLMALPIGSAPRAESGERHGLLRDAREGVSAAARMPAVRVLLLASSGLLMVAGMLNVGELLLARKLGAGAVGYSLLAVAYGVGFVAGSLKGARKRPLPELKRSYLGGMLLIALGLILSGVAPVFAGALMAFAVTGLGNGLLLVHERLIFQEVVPDRFMGRLFAIADTAGSWAIAISLVCAGALVAAVGTRALFLIAGAASLVLWVAAAIALRSHWPRSQTADPAHAAPAAAEA